MKDVEDKVRKARKGDKDALVELVIAKKDQLYRIAYSYVGDEQKALDIMQDTIVKVFHEIGRLREPRYFYSWYIRILINNCKDSIRRNKKILSLDHYKAVKVENPHWKEDWIDVQEGLKRLKEEFREVIIMRYMEDLTIKQIAEILDCAEGTVKSRLHYGLKALRRYVDGKGESGHGMQ